MKEQGSEHQTTRLRVRVRRTEYGPGKSVAERTVACPLEHESVSIDRCSTCDFRECLPAEGRDAEGLFVRCRIPSERMSKGSVAGAWTNAYQTEHAIASLLQRTPVSAVMTTDVTCVDPNLAIEDLAELFLARRFSATPVVDPGGRPLGIISKTDLVREQYEGASAEPSLSGLDKVGDVMTQTAFRLLESESLARTAALMAFERVHRIPIVSADGKVVGVVSSLDIARWLAERAGYVVPPARAP